jgi:integrase
LPIEKLSASKIKGALEDGRLSDGGGLYLSISGGSKVWVFRYRHARNGKTKGGQTKSRFLGLGPLHTVSLDNAREKARALRKLIHDGRDPIQARSQERAAAALEAAKTMSFGECIDQYIEAHRPEWKSPKHIRQWESSLARFAKPVLGKLPVAAIDTGLVMRAVEPIWTTKPETAGRLRQRIESVLDWATVRGYREGDNPARWRGHLDHLLPARGKIRKVRHLASMPYAELPAFMATLRGVEGIAARALEFTILTAVLTGDVCGDNRDDRPPMLWNHVDLDNAMWTIPATKTGVEHRVPLSSQAVAVLRQMEQLREGDAVFPGSRPGSAMSDVAMWNLIKKLAPTATVHGFRSTFRVWSAEQTNFAREVAEAALAHAIGNKVEAAYRRTTFFEKRRRLMATWAEFCSKPAASATVVPLRA